MQRDEEVILRIRQCRASMGTRHPRHMYVLDIMRAIKRNMCGRCFALRWTLPRGTQRRVFTQKYRKGKKMG